MARSWNIVGGAGFEAETLDDPATREMQCPSCRRRGRFVEKELLPAARPTSGPVARGRYVFECPACAVCVVDADELSNVQAQPASATAADVPVHAAASAQDEALLWRQRADLAESRGDFELAREARAVAEQAERRARELTRRVTARDVRGGTDGGGDDHVDRALAALRSRVGGRAPDVSNAQPEDVEGAFAALKARLAGGASTASDAARDTDPSPPSVPPPDENDPVADLKRRLRG